MEQFYKLLNKDRTAAYNSNNYKLSKIKYQRGKIYATRRDASIVGNGITIFLPGDECDFDLLRRLYLPVKIIVFGDTYSSFSDADKRVPTFFSKDNNFWKHMRVTNKIKILE